MEADIKKTKRTTNWEPRIQINEGLALVFRILIMVKLISIIMNCFNGETYLKSSMIQCKTNI